jgi:hypothetical protein
MKRSDSMLTRVEEYLRYRHPLGYALRIEGGMLLNFVRFADQGGDRGPLTCDLAMRWARLPAKADRLYWARRIEVLIGFARYIISIVSLFPKFRLNIESQRKTVPPRDFPFFLSAFWIGRP